MKKINAICVIFSAMLCLFASCSSNQTPWKETRRATAVSYQVRKAHKVEVRKALPVQKEEVVSTESGSEVSASNPDVNTVVFRDEVPKSSSKLSLGKGLFAPAISEEMNRFSQISSFGNIHLNVTMLPIFSDIIQKLAEVTPAFPAPIKVVEKKIEKKQISKPQKKTVAKKKSYHINLNWIPWRIIGLGLLLAALLILIGGICYLIGKFGKYLKNRPKQIDRVVNPEIKRKRAEIETEESALEAQLLGVGLAIPIQEKEREIAKSIAAQQKIVDDAKAEEARKAAIKKRQERIQKFLSSKFVTIACLPWRNFKASMKARREEKIRLEADRQERLKGQTTRLGFDPKKKPGLQQEEKKSTFEVVKIFTRAELGNQTNLPALLNFMAEKAEEGYKIQLLKKKSTKEVVAQIRNLNALITHYHSTQQKDLREQLLNGMTKEISQLPTELGFKGMVLGLAKTHVPELIDFRPRSEEELRREINEEEENQASA